MPKILHIHFSPRRNVGDAAVVMAIRQLVNDAIPGVRWTSLRMPVLGKPPAPALMKCVAASDLIVIGGGGFCSKFVLPMNSDTIASLDKPVVIFGVGQNRNHGDPTLDETQRASLASLASRSALIGVRDRATQALFKDLGFEASLIGDPALFLRPSKPTFSKRLARPAVGINIAAHGWTGQAESMDRLIKFFIEVAIGLQRKHCASVSYLVHHEAELPVAEVLRSLIPGLSVCRARPDRLMYHYSNLDLVISMMLHSAIFAVGSGTPVLAVGYDDKSAAFFHDMGVADRCFDHRTATASELVRSASNLLDAPLHGGANSILRDYEGATTDFVRMIAAKCCRWRVSDS